jgi:hypothetical protein
MSSYIDSHVFMISRVTGDCRRVARYPAVR